MERWNSMLIALILFLLVLATPLTLLGCGEKSAEDSGKEPTEEADREEVPQDDSEPDALPEGFGYDPVQGGSGGIMLLKDVSFEESGGFERIVIELATGAGDPPREGVCMYDARLGEFPYTDEEGTPVLLEGPYFLEITLDSRKADLNLPNAPNVYEGPEVFDLEMALITGAAFVPAYADHTIILLIGLSERALFRIGELSKPSRISIDFAGP